MTWLGPMQIQYSVHTPNQFIRTHLAQLLPSWSAPVVSVLVVLQECQFALLDKTLETERHKQELRSRFLTLGSYIADKLHQRGYLADLFDPQTGAPITSQPGPLKLDDVAVVQASLDYPLTDQGGCAVIEHPDWGSAVYPSILISSAAIEVLAEVVSPISLTGGPLVLKQSLAT